jgi:uncharacterized protein YbjQ (UPF0145 family)
MPADDVFDEFVDDVLSEPEESRDDARTASPPQPIRVVTAPVLQEAGVRVVRMLNAVSAFRCLGTGLLQDLSLALKSTVGGRVGKTEAALAAMYQELMTEIRNAAALKGAGAVVAFRVEVATLGKDALCLIASGTPAVLARVESADGCSTH